jgi:small-conductance mechanosensitive channel
MKLEVMKWFFAGVVVVFLNLLLSAIGLKDLLTLSWLISNLTNFVIGIIGLIIYGWVLTRLLGFTEKVRF